MRNCRSRSACGAGPVLPPRAWREQRPQTGCSRWRSALPWVRLMATGRRPSPSRAASETHFPRPVRECPRPADWSDQDDGRIDPEHSSDLGQRDRDPTGGALRLSRFDYDMSLFDLALDNVVMEPKCGRMELGTELSSGTDSSLWFVRRRSARNAQAAALSRPVSGAGGGSANACGGLGVASPRGCSCTFARASRTLPLMQE